MDLSKNIGNSENNARAEGKGRVLCKQKKPLNSHSYNNAITRTMHEYLQRKVKACVQKYRILKICNMLTLTRFL